MTWGLEIYIIILLFGCEIYFHFLRSTVTTIDLFHHYGFVYRRQTMEDMRFQDLNTHMA